MRLEPCRALCPHVPVALPGEQSRHSRQESYSGALVVLEMQLTLQKKVTETDDGSSEPEVTVTKQLPFRP